MNSKFPKIIISILCILLIVSSCIRLGTSCFTPNILSHIGESKNFIWRKAITKAGK